MLTIDLDTRAALRDCVGLLQYAIEHGFYPLENLFSVEIRRTRRGWHIYLDTYNTMTEYELIAWQACLGSDKMREIMTLVKMHEGLRNQNCSVLFQQKGKFHEYLIWKWTNDQGLEVLFKKLEALKK